MPVTTLAMIVSEYDAEIECFYPLSRSLVGDGHRGGGQDDIPENSNNTRRRAQDAEKYTREVDGIQWKAVDTKIQEGKLTPF
ncbi:hypothetical protein TGVAND_438610 [Toxoplasma gondii VAND]|uniref:Uncharacterized protein n=1 Tax=Toxoplasma gondii VAND TaxID=933077 RepID=A0A086PG39_TOXGO|nr:hypothetical protein TGVAND_438610 [Toxoplasma gondii VAND]